MLLIFPGEKLNEINVDVPDDGTQTRPKWVNANKQIVYLSNCSQWKESFIWSKRKYIHCSRRTW